MANYQVIDVAQRTPAWFAARLGRLTGSRAKDMLATIKTGEAAARRDYRMELVCERLTGEADEDGFVSDAMQRGIDLEGAAFAAYESATGSMVDRTGFLSHTVHMAGCSLDGSVDGFAGIVEIKCPKTATHVGYLRAGAVPANHMAQITHNLWICDTAQWCDFVSYDDRLPESLRTVIYRVRREDVDLKTYEEKALAFLREVDDDVNELLSRGK